MSRPPQQQSPAVKAPLPDRLSHFLNITRWSGGDFLSAILLGANYAMTLNYAVSPVGLHQSSVMAAPLFVAPLLGMFIIRSRSRDPERPRSMTGTAGLIVAVALVQASIVILAARH